jgi:putative alpha-1,2-mannosidase
MRRRLLAVLSAVLLCCLASFVLHHQDVERVFRTRLSRSRDAPLALRHRVDPFIGSAGTGHVTPGAKLPFGMIYLVPRNPQDYRDWDYCAGYQHGKRAFLGVAHTALSGAGINMAKDVTLSPFVGHGGIVDERADPGVYTVTVTEHDPTLASTERAVLDYVKVAPTHAPHSPR